MRKLLIYRISDHGHESWIFPPPSASQGLGRAMPEFVMPIMKKNLIADVRSLLSSAVAECDAHQRLMPAPWRIAIWKCLIG